MLSNSGFRRIPYLESRLHLRICEEGEASIALHRPIDGAGHIGAPHYLGGRNLNLMEEARGVRDGGAVHNAIESGPQGARHAHWAGLAGGVQSVVLKRR